MARGSRWGWMVDGVGYGDGWGVAVVGECGGVGIVWAGG